MCMCPLSMREFCLCHDVWRRFNKEECTNIVSNVYVAIL